MANGKCVVGVDLQARTKMLEANFVETKKTFGRIFDELKEIRGLLTSRPTWTVLGIVSFLSSAVVGLLIVLFEITGK
jgi:hypothetical protein